MLAGMDFLIPFLIFLHLLCWAMLLGLCIGYIRKREVPKGVMHSAGGALLTGLLIVGAVEMGTDAEINHIKIGAKLLVALVVMLMAVWAERKQDGHRWLGPIAGLTVVNVALAVFW